MALLARQAWCVLEDSGLLRARILKAVYFPSGEVLDAELGLSLSRVWQAAILGGKEVLQQGIIKRIGDGKSTIIWRAN